MTRRGRAKTAGPPKESRTSSTTRRGAAYVREIAVEEFVRRLHHDQGADKCFAPFPGAGCSVSSGIPAAGSLVAERWLPRLRDLRAPERKDLEAWATTEIPGFEAQWGPWQVATSHERAGQA